jgi:hypothetical protein
VSDNQDLFPNYNDSTILGFISEYNSTHNYISSEDIQDLRAGSTLIEVSGSQATVQLQMEESSDLKIWENTGDPAAMSVPVPTDSDTKFYSFKIAD